MNNFKILLIVIFYYLIGVLYGYDFGKTVGIKEGKKYVYKEVEERAGGTLHMQENGHYIFVWKLDLTNEAKKKLEREFIETLTGIHRDEKTKTTTTNR